MHNTATAPVKKIARFPMKISAREKFYAEIAAARNPKYTADNLTDLRRFTNRGKNRAQIPWR
jgi:hypothetical protein